MQHLILTLCSFLVLLLAGCQSTDPYAYEQQVEQDRRYQSNAMTRYVLGLSTDQDNIPKTAPIGGLSEASADHYMAQQTKALQSELADTGVDVERKGNDIHLVMPGNITFGSDSHDLKPSFFPILDAVARVLMHYDQTLLQVVGYTDSRGNEKYNEELSLLRAETVENYLLNAGITAVRVESKGMGEKNPVASNDTEQGRAKNRRVELKISAL